MKRHTIAMAILAVSIILLGACGESVDESNADSGKQLNNSGSTQEVDLSNEDSSEDTNPEPSGVENESTAPSTESNDGEQQGETKDAYLKKLNEMEEADRYSENTTTTVELIDQETARYEKWDKELNEIYGLLKEQLSQEKMDSLREDQREWIIHRDETAKESSSKYKGGSMESLEYVATQAELTRDRCYLLVAKYMN